MQICQTRRTALAILAASLVSRTLHAADEPYPTKAIRQIVAWPAGGGTDAAARIIGEQVGGRLRQPVPTENRAGASGYIAVDAVLNAPADGYTLLTTILSALAAGPALIKSDVVARSKALTPIAVLGAVPNVLVVGPDSPFNSVADVIQAAKSTPGKVNYASSGNGGSMHLSAELFCSLAGISLTNIPYKGGAPAVIDVAAGQVHVAFATIPSALSLIQSKKLKALAVTGTSRSPLLPDVPTVGEAGVPAYAYNDYYVVFTSPKVSPAVVRVLEQAFSAALSERQVQEKLVGLGVLPYDGKVNLAQLVQSETTKWTKILKATGIQPT